VTDWVAIGNQSPALEPDFFVQNANCISRAVSAATKGMWFDIGAGNELDFAASGTEENMLVYMWMRCNTPGLLDTLANGGMEVRLGTTTSNFGRWYVGGNDYGIADNDGWVCVVIDPSTATSADGGSGLTLSSVRYFGGVITTTTQAKGQNFGIDRISYGRGEIRGTGTATSGKGFQDLADWDWGTIGNRWGIITEKNGIIFVKGKIVIGDNSGSLATTFTSENEQVVFENGMYYQGTTRVPTVPDADEDDKSYFGVEIVGNGTGATTVTMGVAVGTDRGRNGPSFTAVGHTDLTTPARPETRITADSNVNSLDVYGTTFRNLERASPNNAIDLGNQATADKFMSNVVDGCGRVRLGAMEARNCIVSNSFTDTNDGALLWDNSTDLEDSLFVNNTHSTVFEATTGTPFAFTNLTFNPTALGVRNESDGAITINVTGAPKPTAENAGTSSTTINATYDYTMTNIANPTEVTIIRTSDSAELYHVEAVTTGTTTYQHDGTVEAVTVLLMSVAEKQLVFEDTLGAGTVSFPVSQVTDPFYSNP